MSVLVIKEDRVILGSTSKFAIAFKNNVLRMWDYQGNSVRTETDSNITMREYEDGYSIYADKDCSLYVKKDGKRVIELEGDIIANAFLETLLNDDEDMSFSVHLKSDVYGNKFREPICINAITKSVKDLIKAFDEVGIHIVSVNTDVKGTFFTHHVEHKDLSCFENEKGNKMTLLFSKGYYLIAYKDDKLQIWNLDLHYLWRRDNINPIIETEADGLVATIAQGSDNEDYVFNVRIESDIYGNKLAEPIEFMMYAEPEEDIIREFNNVGIYVRELSNDCGTTTFDIVPEDDIKGTRANVLFSKDCYFIAYKGKNVLIVDLRTHSVIVAGSIPPFVKIGRNYVIGTATLKEYNPENQSTYCTICIESDNGGNKLEPPIQFEVRAESIVDLINTLKDVGIHIRTIYNELDSDEKKTLT